MDRLIEQHEVVCGQLAQSMERIEELQSALKIAFAAIGVARCIRAVSDEFDFEPAYDAVRNALLPDKRN